MARLAAHCRKHVTEKMKCSKTALSRANKKCEKETGMAQGLCRTAKYEDYLAAECADVVCPNDPNRFAATGVATSSKTTDLNADKGGEFDKVMDQFNIQSSTPATGPDSGGSDPQKMKMYLLGGVIVATVVVLAMGKKK